MHYKFTFVSQFLFPVTKVCLIGDFNGWSAEPNILTQECETWSTELDLEAGSYGYKFLINDIVRINDPNCPVFTVNDFGEIASTFSIGEKILVKPDTGSNNLKLSTFRFTKGFDIEDPSDENDTTYILGNDRNAICRLLFSGATQKHVVSCFWYTPENNCFNSSESFILSKENESSDVKTLWFWLNLQDPKLHLGNWSVQIFIDGVMAHQDSFCIEVKERKVPVDTTKSEDYLLEDILNTYIDDKNSQSIQSQSLEVETPDNLGFELIDLTSITDEIKPTYTENNLLESFETDIPLFDEVPNPIEPKKDTDNKEKEEDYINVIDLFND